MQTICYNTTKKNTDLHLVYTFQLFPRKGELVHHLSQSFAIHGESFRSGEPRDVMKIAVHTLRNERIYSTGARMLQKGVKADMWQT